MRNDSQFDPTDEPLAPVMDKVEREVANFFRDRPNVLRSLFLLTFLLTLSPLVVFLFDSARAARWSEVVKKYLLSVLAGPLFPQE